jgi:hypothetical protein
VVGHAAPVRVVLLLAICLFACGDNIPGTITIRSASTFEPALIEYARTTQYPLNVTTGQEASEGFTIAVIEDPSIPAQAYQLAKLDDREITVAASDVLGAQYGTTAALEAMGFRFRHPFDTLTPIDLEIGEVDNEIHRPQIRVRGFQFHTLHPTEAYFAFWEPSAQNTEDAHRIIDWTIKNRGNYIQWVALDDIITDPRRFEAWKPFTKELIDYAHARGVRVGLNIQLFGAANLQLAFDLVDDTEADIEPQIAARLPLITEGLPFDVYDLSFGEFFNSDPQVFIDSVNEVHRQFALAAPQAELHAFVHVGADQIVNFNGEDMIYYFLVQFANPAIIPDVHTVMFYNLYESAGGAYHHEDFSEHREFLLERMCSGQPVAYIPETAYWVAFDNSVPQYFPLYVHNRWLDLEMLDAEPGCGMLDNHVLFSTGWEWGYWLNDVTALRASYERPPTSTDLIAAEFGSDLGPATDIVARLIEIQRTHLMLGELVQYMAGRDTAIDAGRQLGIVSQPDRMTFDDLVTTDATTRAAFQSDVMTALVIYREAVIDLENELAAIDMVDNRWTREVREGLAMDRLRAEFVIELYGATLNQLAGDSEAAQSDLLRARSLLGAAGEIVSRRHGDLHDGLGAKLLERTSNRTTYQYGYLNNADTLCFWNRELIQVEGILDNSTEIPPNCLF